MGTASFDLGLKRADPVYGLVDELLPSETGENRHHQEEIHLTYIFIQLLDRHVRIYGQSYLHPRLLRRLYDGRSLPSRSLEVETHHLHAHTRESLKPSLRLDYHKMGIHRNGHNLAYGFDYRKSERDVRDERAVHHIQMDIIGAGIYHLEILFQMQKICGKNGRCDFHIIRNLRPRLRDDGQICPNSPIPVSLPVRERP